MVVGEWQGPRRSGRGGVVEWLMALVLKTSEVKASVGSNPTPSASKTPQHISSSVAAAQQSLP